jgi:hypothetical protein
MRRVLSSAPFDLVYFFFDFKRFEIVKLRFVGLEFRMKLVFAGFFLWSISDG